MSRSGTSSEPNFGKGLVAGLAGGLVGSWLMMRFIRGPGPVLERAVQGAPEPVSPSDGHGDIPDSVTMQAADLFFNKATGGGHLTHEEREHAGELVHYLFGTMMGVGYGVAAEYLPWAGAGLGSVFGTVLWMGTDLTSIPATGFAKPPAEEPGSAHVAHWAAHVVYTVTMELVRRGVRRLV